MDKQEGLKELRNKILRIFGESLDEYILEKDEFVKSVNNLGILKAQLLEEIKGLSNQKAKLTSDLIKLGEEKLLIEGDIVKHKEEADKNIQDRYSRSDAEISKRINDLKLREEQVGNIQKNKRFETEGGASH